MTRHLVPPADRIRELREMIREETPLRDAQPDNSPERQHFQEIITEASHQLIRWKSSAARIAKLQADLARRRDQLRSTQARNERRADAGRRRVGYAVLAALGLIVVAGLVQRWWAIAPTAAAVVAAVLVLRAHTRALDAAEGRERAAQAKMEEVEDELIGVVTAAENGAENEHDDRPGVLVTPQSAVAAAQAAARRLRAVPDAG